MQNTSLIKGFNIIYMSLRNCTLKQWRSTIHYTLIRMTKNLFKTNNTKCWPGCGVIRTLIYCQWECKMVQTLWETVGWLLVKLNILLAYNPAIIFLGIYPEELKSYVHTKTGTWLFYSSFIHNCENLEATKMFLSRWMDK